MPTRPHFISHHSGCNRNSQSAGSGPVGERVSHVHDDAVIVELKAVETVLPVHGAQVLSYLRMTNKQLGLLINFHVERKNEFLCDFAALRQPSIRQWPANREGLTDSTFPSARSLDQGAMRARRAALRRRPQQPRESRRPRRTWQSREAPIPIRACRRIVPPTG